MLAFKVRPGNITESDVKELGGHTWVISPQDDTLRCFSYTFDDSPEAELDYVDMLKKDIEGSLGIPLNQMEAVIYHESLPGHRLEASHAMRQGLNLVYELEVEDSCDLRSHEDSQEIMIKTLFISQLFKIYNELVLTGQPGRTVVNLG